MSLLRYNTIMFCCNDVFKRSNFCSRDSDNQLTPPRDVDIDISAERPATAINVSKDISGGVKVNSCGSVEHMHLGCGVATIPTAAEGADQRHGGHRAVAAQLHGAAFDAGQVAFRVEQVEIARTAGVVQLLGQVGRAARRYDGLVDLLGLTGQDAQ